MPRGKLAIKIGNLRTWGKTPRIKKHWESEMARRLSFTTPEKEKNGLQKG